MATFGQNKKDQREVRLSLKKKTTCRWQSQMDFQRFLITEEPQKDLSTGILYCFPMYLSSLLVQLEVPHLLCKV